MSFFNLPQGQSAYGLIGQQLGQGVGTGIQEGMGTHLQRMFEQKQNTSTANGLADNLGLKGEKRTNFVTAFKNIPSKDQLTQLSKLAEAQLYMSYLGGNQTADQ